MTTTDSGTRVFPDVDAFRAAVGEVLGVGDWFEITQERIDAFADVTEDWQWIRVDPDGPRRAPTAPRSRTATSPLPDPPPRGRDLPRRQH
jgi:acyl dehydratase